MKTKFNLKWFGRTFGTLGLIEKFFLNTLRGFIPYWDYKPTNALHVDSLGVYTSDKSLNLGTIDNIHLKCDAIDDSVVNRIPEPILSSLFR